MALKHYANPELAAIAEGIQAGMYAGLEQKLHHFLLNSRHAIEHERTAWEQRLKRPVSPFFAAKQLILRTKSIDFLTEINLQREEMRKEAWYRHDPDHDRVAMDWAKKHAAGWRDHYTLTLALLLDVQEERFYAQYAASRSIPG